MEQRQNRRYRLKASITFSWEHMDGSKVRGQGYTRDISPAGVFVLTSDRLPSGTPMKLEVILPSLNEKRSGASLRTQGRVVRSEESGFPAAADMGFRMRFPEASSSPDSASNSGGKGKFEASSKRNDVLALVPVSRFCM
jgi:PilZ domain-containing protein